MRCIFCYQEPIIGINSRTQTRKRLISYYKTNGITFFKKHADVKHIVIVKMFEEKVNFLLKGSVEIQLAKKIGIVYSGSIFEFFFVKNSFKKEDVSHKEF
jgi:hypothetical protein